MGYEYSVFSYLFICFIFDLFSFATIGCFYVAASGIKREIHLFALGLDMGWQGINIFFLHKHLFFLATLVCHQVDLKSRGNQAVRINVFPAICRKVITPYKTTQNVVG